MQRPRPLTALARIAACACVLVALGCPADSAGGSGSTEQQGPGLTADGAAPVAEAWIASGGKDEALLLGDASAELLAASHTTRLDLGGASPTKVELVSGGSREPDDPALADDTFALDTPAGRSDRVISYDLTYRVETAGADGAPVTREVVVSLRPTATGWIVLPPPPGPDAQGD